MNYAMYNIRNDMSNSRSSLGTLQVHSHYLLLVCRKKYTLESAIWESAPRCSGKYNLTECSRQQFSMALLVLVVKRKAFIMFGIVLQTGSGPQRAVPIAENTPKQIPQYIQRITHVTRVNRIISRCKVNQ